MSKLDSKVAFNIADDGVVRVTGEVNYHTVIQLLAATDTLLAGAGPWTIDMSGVDRSDSSAVAWMLELLRTSQKKSVAIKFQSVPEEIKSVARVSGVEELIPFTR